MNDGTSSQHHSDDASLRGLTVIAATSALSACGGGTSSTPNDPPPPPPPPAGITTTEAARFLAQASLGATDAEIARVQSQGYAGWLDAQMALPHSQSNWDWLMSRGFDAMDYRNSQLGTDAMAWRKFIASPDTLRQRIVLALSEILVVSAEGLTGGGWRQFRSAAYLDILDACAFGNYRTLLDQVTTSAAMANYLTYLGNKKEDRVTGRQPDENYARELMQLFTIGLHQLNADGSLQLSNGKPQETYGQSDVTGLARVFTGWNFDPTTGGSTPERNRRPLVQVAADHEFGEKSFLGTTIPAGTDGVQSLKLALDAIFAHPNVGPFVGRQLIQRLVTSNPSPAYIARVSAAFANNGSGVRGDMRAVIKAVLLDDEARNSANLTAPAFGKLREPMLRFVGWARAYNATSPSNAWDIGDLSDAGTRLGQSPLRSPSVFNFFRPGYVPPNTPFSQQQLLAPEFQIVNESSTVGYVNFMQTVVVGGVNKSDITVDYNALLPVADDTVKLVQAINLVLAANQVGSATAGTIANAVASLPAGNDSARLTRIHAALTLLMAAPEYLAQK